uniref:Tripartite motif-containing protein 2 n=1 Tax=Magallana gigas TaxID=29159 RepID=K1PFM4_MAGGI
MATANSLYSTHKCSKCPGDTEYHCVSCPCDLCPQCKENHVKDLQTIDHDVVSHRDKINYIPTQEICVRHPSHVYTKYCEPCQVPVCDSCSEDQSHRFKSVLYGQGQHEIMDIQIAYKTKRQQHRGTIHTIRSEALFYRPVLLPRIKADVKTCHTEFSLYQSEMLTKAQKLKDLIDYVVYDLLNYVFCYFDFKHRCEKQKIEMIRHIVRLRRYELRYVQPEFTFSALQFLSSIKTALPQKHLTLHTSQLSMTESLNKEDVMESLSAIQITERGNRRVGNQCLLKLTSGAEFHQSLTVTGVDWCRHISCMTSDRVWVSDDRNNLMLTDTTGVPLHRVEDSWSDLYNGGLHTVNSESELIYIDRNYNIKKLSKNMKTTTTFIERTDSTWWPWCVYWSPSTGDLLVGMCNNDTKTGKVTRYNQSGQLTQTIQNNNTGMGLYRGPNYITENNNGDVVVSNYNYISESGAVVVTERGGRHRFSYTGNPSGSGLGPCGICTDALSHILVCDWRTKTVQMLDSNGQFLSHLLIRPSGIFSPWSLSYDVNTHRLWVGSYINNTVVIYRYITRQDALTDLNPATADVMESLSESPTPGTEKPQQGNQCLLKLMSPPELLPSLTLTGVRRCYHISCVTSDRVWVSDGHNLVLTDTTGVPLHRVEDSWSGDIFTGNGLHTVNSESELIYIDRNYNINKLSKDMKTTTTFIERTDSTWRPQCVYWSPSTGDLLVGMYNDDTKTAKVTRYNQSGQLTQTIQNDNTGMGLYSKPSYITENNNGDVVVSDDESAVVVTERGGRHRFSYTGPPSGSGLEPRGICTDPLSHILVCDYKTKTVQMIDRDGQFLSHLLTESQEIYGPWSLSYDVNTHRLWVGSGDNNMVDIYRYITRQDALTDEHRPRPDEEAMSSSTPAFSGIVSNKI